MLYLSCNAHSCKKKFFGKYQIPKVLLIDYIHKSHIWEILQIVITKSTPREHDEGDNRCYQKANIPRREILLSTDAI